MGLPNTQIQRSNRYDVVAHYHASGSKTKTTGSISSSSNSLTVASNASFAIGHGIFIQGAGATQRSVADGVLNSSTTVTSATMVFDSDDVGKIISGTGIPTGTYIVSITSATSIVISATATATASSVTLAIKKDLVSTITAILGTTITIADNASTTVSSLRVQHDDSAAINAAIADCMNNGGGVVHLPLTGCDGYYRCNGPFDATTNSIITFPQNIFYGGIPPHVVIEGECYGGIVNNNFDSLDGLDVSGCVMECTRAPKTPSMNFSSFMSTAPLIITTPGNYLTSFNCVHPVFKNLMVIVANNPAIHGVNFGNAMRGEIHDSFIFSIADAGATWSLNTHSAAAPYTSAAILPFMLNNVISGISRTVLVGFLVGLSHGEHCRFAKPYISQCEIGLVHYGIHHICSGDLSIENCNLFIYTDPNAIYPTYRLHLESEGTSSGPFAVAGTTTIQDNTNVSSAGTLKGIIDYVFLHAGGTPGGRDTMTIYTPAGSPGGLTLNKL